MCFMIACHEQKPMIIKLLKTGFCVPKQRSGHLRTVNAITKIPPIPIPILPQHNKIQELYAETNIPG